MLSNRFCIDAGLYQLAEVRFQFTLCFILRRIILIGCSGITAFIDQGTVSIVIM